jgi:hypothetical protein
MQKKLKVGNLPDSWGYDFKSAIDLFVYFIIQIQDKRLFWYVT